MTHARDVGIEVLRDALAVAEAELASLKAERATFTRFKLDTIQRIGGHCGEEQWTETVMSRADDGEWVMWSALFPPVSSETKP